MKPPFLFLLLLIALLVPFSCFSIGENTSKPSDEVVGETIPEEPTTGNTDSWISEENAVKAAAAGAVTVGVAGTGVGIHKGFQKAKKEDQEPKATKATKNEPAAYSTAESFAKLTTGHQEVYAGLKEKNVCIIIDGLCQCFESTKAIGEKIGKGIYQTCKQIKNKRKNPKNKNPSILNKRKKSSPSPNVSQFGSIPNLSPPRPVSSPATVSPSLPPPTKPNK